MIFKNIIGQYYIYGALVLITLVSIIYPEFILPGIAISVSLLVLQLQPLKHTMFLIVFLLVTLSGDLSTELRNILNIFSFVFLVYFFIHQRGFAFTTYPGITKPLSIFIAGVILSMALSSLFSLSIITGLTETGRQIIFFVIWYILFSAISDGRDLFKLLSVLIISASVLGFIIIYHMVTSGVSVVSLIAEGILHEGGILNNPAAAGGVFAVAIPLTISFRFSYSDNRRFKYLLSCFIFVQVIGLLLTNSRAAVIAVLISTLILMFILKTKILVRSVAVLLAVIVLTMILFPFTFELVQLYFRTGRILENTRYLLWEMSAGIIADNPVWGTGPGLFKSQMYQHFPVMFGTWSAQQIQWVYESSGLGESHNFYLFRTAELGIAGFISAAALPIMFVFYSIKTMKAYFHNKKIFPVSAGIFSLGIGLFSRSFLEATGLLSHGWISRDLPFWVCFAAIVFLYQNRSAKSLQII